MEFQIGNNIMEKQLYLKRLIEKNVTKTGLGTSTTFPIRESKDDSSTERMEMALELYLEDYYLEIYNPITIMPPNKELNDFVGLKVIAIEERKDKAQLIFDNGHRITINMKDDAYYGPEEMSLYGRDNFCAVWN